MTDEQLKERFERVCAECEECYYYCNCDTEEECFGEEEPCFEWQPRSRKQHIAELLRRLKMAEYINKADLLQAYNEIRPYLATKVAEFTEILKNFPTADVQPVKRGRWIEVTPRHSKCSICDTTCLIAVYPISKNANYCPNCGALMTE